MLNPEWKPDSSKTPHVVPSTTMKVEKPLMYRLYGDFYRSYLVPEYKEEEAEPEEKPHGSTCRGGCCGGVYTAGELDVAELIPKRHSVFQARDTSVRLVNGALMSITVIRTLVRPETRSDIFTHAEPRVEKGWR